jgi:hypothetical protein
MPQCHGWGWRPPLIASHIHIGHIYSVMAPFNDVSVHIMNAPLLCYTTKARSDFGNSGVTAEWKWCHDSWLRLQTTFNCFSHPYWKYIVCFGTFQWCQCVYYEWTLTLTTLLYQQTWIRFWQFWGHCRVEMMPWCHGWGCLYTTFDCFSHPYWMYKYCYGTF